MGMAIGYEPALFVHSKRPSSSSRSTDALKSNGCACLVLNGIARLSCSGKTHAERFHSRSARRKHSRLSRGHCKLQCLPPAALVC